MPTSKRFFPHTSDDLREEVRHVQDFLARVFRGNIAASQEPRLQTLQRAQAQPGGQNAGVPAGVAGGGSAAPTNLGGDVQGPPVNNSVAALQQVTLTLTSLVSGQVLSYNGTALVNTNSVGALTLAGDLTLSTHNLVTDAVTGTQIGTAATQKLAFFGAAPVVQQTGASAAGIAAVADPPARAALAAIQNALAALGLVTAPP